jgi:hypothetical protein
MKSKRGLSIIFIVVVLIALMANTAFGATTTVTVNGIVLTYPDYPRSSGGFNACNLSALGDAASILLSNLPEGANVDLGFVYAFEATQAVTHLPIQTYNNVTGGSLQVAVPYPPIESWPANAQGEKILTMSVNVTVNAPDGTQTKLTSRGWWGRCVEEKPTPTFTATSTPTEVPPTATFTATSTPTEVPPTPTFTATFTPTSVPPTATFTATFTPTSVPPTPTFTATFTPTSVPPTPTFTATPTATPVAFQGCTPGYWRQSQHFDSWAATGYAPSDSFGAVFGVTPSFSPSTLLDAVWLGGGGENALARHAVAGLLNAAHPSVSYPLNPAQVISGVQFSYATGSFEAFKDILDAANNAGCPLN